jgi:hypothetical protein
MPDLNVAGGLIAYGWVRVTIESQEYYLPAFIPQG